MFDVSGFMLDCLIDIPLVWRLFRLKRSRSTKARLWNLECHDGRITCRRACCCAASVCADLFWAGPAVSAVSQSARMTRSAGKPAYQGKPHMLVPVRPAVQSAGLQGLKLPIAVATPDPQTSAFPGMEVSRKIQSPTPAAATATV